MRKQFYGTRGLARVSDLRPNVFVCLDQICLLPKPLRVRMIDQGVGVSNPAVVEAEKRLLGRSFNAIIALIGTRRVFAKARLVEYATIV